MLAIDTLQVLGSRTTPPSHMPLLLDGIAAATTILSLFAHSARRGRPNDPHVSAFIKQWRLPIVYDKMVASTVDKVTSQHRTPPKTLHLLDRHILIRHQKSNRCLPHSDNILYLHPFLASLASLSSALAQILPVYAINNLKVQGDEDGTFPESVPTSLYVSNIPQLSGIVVSMMDVVITCSTADSRIHNISETSNLATATLSLVFRLRPSANQGVLASALGLLTVLSKNHRLASMIWIGGVIERPTKYILKANKADLTGWTSALALVKSFAGNGGSKSSVRSLNDLASSVLVVPIIAQGATKFWHFAQKEEFGALMYQELLMKQRLDTLTAHPSLPGYTRSDGIVKVQNETLSIIKAYFVLAISLVSRDTASSLLVQALYAALEPTTFVLEQSAVTKNIEINLPRIDDDANWSWDVRTMFPELYPDVLSEPVAHPPPDSETPPVELPHRSTGPLIFEQLSRAPNLLPTTISGYIDRVIRGGHQSSCLIA
ncbi:hypothetical protein HDU93_009001 [Gonapodya sp. JEL0774]|nr:hypothetical protein HDU93_009001 [Gonapodya sp. JEL0774]